MRAITYTAVRSNLATTMKEVCDDHDPVIVTRKNSESVIIISLEDYESLTETTYLLQSPKNAQRLFESIKELNAGKGKQRELVR
jgi:antitoxin YefM